MATDKNKIKDNFRTEENLPEEFSWENMEQGINEKMESNKTKRPIGFFINTALALFVIIIAGSIFYNADILSKNSGKQKSFANKSIVDSKDRGTKVNGILDVNDLDTSLSARRTEEIKKIEKTFALKTENGSAEVTISKEVKTTLKYKELTSNNKNLQKRSEKLVQDNFKNIDNINSNDLNTFSDNEKNLHPIELNKTDKINSDVKPSDEFLDNRNEKINTAPSRINIALIEHKSLHIIKGKSPELPFIEILNLSIKENDSKGLKNSLLLSSGLVYPFSKYGNNSLDAIKGKYERDALGYSFGIGYNRDISNKLSLNIGIDYTTIRNILDYNETTNYSELRENLLLSMDINTITGDTIKTYGTGTVTGKQTRRVLHYNTQKVLSIPFVIGYNIPKGKFNYTVGLGPVVNLNINADGRTINAIADFQNIDKHYYKDINFGIRAMMGVNCSISKRFFLGLNFHYSTPLNQWNSNSTFSLHKNMLTGNLSAGYKF